MLRLFNSLKRKTLIVDSQLCNDLASASREKLGACARAPARSVILVSSKQIALSQETGYKMQYFIAILSNVSRVGFLPLNSLATRRRQLFQRNA